MAETKVKTISKGDDTKEKAEAPKMVSFRELFRYATTQELAILGFGWIMACGAGSTQPLLMVLFGDLTSATSSASADIAALVNPIAIRMLYVAVAAITLYFSAYFCIPWIAARQAKRIREEYFKAVLRQEMQFFDHQKPGALSVEFQDTIHEIYKGISQKMVEIVDASAQLVVGQSLAFYFSWKLALACAAGLPLMGISAAAMVKAGGTDGVFGAQEYMSAGSIASEALSAMRTVASFGGEVALANKYGEKLDNARSAAIIGATKGGSAAGVMMATFTALYALGFGVGGELVRQDRINYINDFPAPTGLLDSTLTSEWQDHAFWAEAFCLDSDGDLYENDGTGTSAFAICACDLPWYNILDEDGNALENPGCGCGSGRSNTGALIGSGSGCEDVGSIMTAFFCFIFGGFALGQISPALEAITKARIAAHKIFKVIDRDPKIDIEAEGKTFDKPPQGTIEFRDVHFRYSKQGDEGKEETRPVFAGLNLTINPGETVALVGESGSGKSTIGRLLGRIYDPTQGSIFLDGVDIKELNVNHLRSHIGLVSQEPLLFDQTIKENIMLGRNGEVAMEEVEAAAKAANAHDFISSNQFPLHYDTNVGFGGSKLSGGQKQRIAIARAILRNPPIMILDEATSALDTKSEAIVQKALDKLVGADGSKVETKRTTLVIAHRLSTVRKADRIVVLGEDEKSRGSVIREQGTHEELMELEGYYYALVGGQAAASGSHEGTKEEKAVDKKDTATVETVAITTESEDSEEESAAAWSCCGGNKEKKEEKEPEIPSSRVWAYNGGNMHYAYIGVLCSCLNGAIQPGIALIFSEMLSTYTNYDTDTMQSQLIRWAIFFIGLAVCQVFFHFGQVAFMTIVGEHITTNLRIDAFRAMLRQDITYFDEPENNVGALTSQLGADAARVQLTAGQSLGALVNSVTAVIFGFTVAFVESWEITVVILGGVPVILIANVLMMQILANGEKGVQDTMVECVGMVNEAVSNMREVQAFSLQPQMANHLSKLLDYPLGIQKNLAFKGGLSFGFVQGAFFGFYALAFWWGGQVITKNSDVTFENFMKSLFALAFSAMGAGQAATFAGDQAKAMAAKERIFKLIDRVPPIDTQPWTKDGKERPYSDCVIPDHDFNGEININKVTFAYPTRKDAKVFCNTSISIAAGTTVALVGTSGSGKSTTIQLLERFYDPEVDGKTEVKVGSCEKITGTLPDNSILLDGYDIRTLDVKWLRSHVGLVGQEPVLFFGSIYENIAAGKANATREEVEAAAKAANAHDFIMKGEGGYERNVGDRGGNLSGGQKQRVAIARAIIKKPRILLLDEATSALDNESEKIVQASLDALIADKDTQRTTVIIAHRLSTIRNADMIYVLDNDGSGAVVVEQGTHEELLKLEGTYKNLCKVFDGGNSVTNSSRPSTAPAPEVTV